MHDCRCRHGPRQPDGRVPEPSSVDVAHTRVSTESACDRCGARSATMMPAAYIGCFLSGGIQGRVVQVRCGACGDGRYELVAGVHDAGCPALSSPLFSTFLSPPPRVPAPAPDPLHVRPPVARAA